MFQALQQQARLSGFVLLRSPDDSPDASGNGHDRADAHTQHDSEALWEPWTEQQWFEAFCKLVRAGARCAICAGTTAAAVRLRLLLYGLEALSNSKQLREHSKSRTA